MMRFYPLLTLIMFLGTLTVFGQDNMGIGTASPEPSSVLHLDATDKGFLIPRLTTPQRVAIAGPATGLMVFDTDFNNFWFYDGAQWVQAIGPMGPTGGAGLDGTNGVDGSTGAMGPTGAAGLDGTNGVDGSTGAIGSTGAAGLDGTNGVDGSTGAMGPTG
ncbi:MAG: hypothetical protein ACI9P8_001628, partial [Bacteroidia bacterium]